MGEKRRCSSLRDRLADYAADAADDEPDRRWFMATLVREPENEYDENAIAVHAQGVGLVGYLRREDARTYRQVFESLEKRGHDAATCPAMLTGEHGKSYGVVLAISAPGYVLNELTAGERVAARESRTRERESRDRSVYEAADASESWKAIAAAHGYETPGGAYATARKYAERHGLELPRRGAGRPPKRDA